MIQIKNLDRIIGMQSNGRVIMNASYEENLMQGNDPAYRFTTQFGEELRLAKPYSEGGAPYRLFVMGYRNVTEVDVELNYLRSASSLAMGMYNCLEKLDKHLNKK